MKKMITAVIAASFLLFGINASAQNDVIAKLDKQGYCPITKGLTLKYANYDKRGELSSYYTLEVASIDGTLQDGTVVFNQYFYDEDGKEMFKDGNNVPMTIIVNSDGTFSKMENVGKVMKIQDLISKGDASTIFPPLSIGSKLKDGHVKLSIGSVEANLYTNDRNVTDCQTITTKAGTFKDCYLIKEVQKTKTIFSKTENIETWYAPGIGCVKQTVRDDKGRLVSTQELIEISIR